jgi:diadenosine tetraphosphate (Ap4A) HIT family hydrolase
MRIFGLFAVLLLAAACASGETSCACDPANPETLKQRQCSLCVESERQPADLRVFFLKDANPRKPNRTLALPRSHKSGLHPMDELSTDERIELWTAAIGKAKELWGDQWAVAYNGDKVRTQCHLHIHVGKLLPGVEAGEFVEISTIAEIPPTKGYGMWIHPSGNGKMHVHTGEQIAETVLLR